LVRDDPKLLDDSGEVPKSKRVVGSSIPNYEFVPLLDRKLARSPKMPHVFQKEKEKENI
jgi:hypothetical protein